MTPKELRGALRRQLNPRRATWQKPAALVRALGLRRGQVVAEIGSRDELSKRIYASYQEFRTLIADWGEISGRYLNSRRPV